MTTEAFLAGLRRLDVRVWVDGDELKCSAPTGALTPEVLEQLRRRKHEILALLKSATAAVRHRAIVPLQPRGTRPPLFGVPGHNGDVFCYRSLAEWIGDDQPVYGLQPPGLDARSEPLARIPDLARYFATQIRSFLPSAPCVVAGFCAGGMTAFELGRQLQRDGRDVTVALLGAAHPSRYQRFPRLGDLGLRLEIGISWVHTQARTLRSLPGPERWAYLGRKWRRSRDRRRRDRSAGLALRLRARMERATLRAARRYAPRPFAGRLILLASSKAWLRSRDVPLRWRALARDFEVYTGPDRCTTDDLLREPYVHAFAELLTRSCPAKPDHLPAPGAAGS